MVVSPREGTRSPYWRRSPRALARLRFRSATFRFRNQREGGMLRLAIAGLGLLVFAPTARASDDLAVNRALGAQVTPAAAAALVDGDASTSYCPDGPVTVDLGRPVQLSG